jgi:hypothetical protein
VSRRFAAPLLLLAAAAVSLAAVFAVHRIEATGGPVGQPSVTRPFFSPNGDGVQDTTEVAFTTHDSEHVTVRIVDHDGHLVRELMHRRHVDGRATPGWNGHDENGDIVDGTYVVRITLDGSSRVFEPVTPIVVDTTPPVARLDRGTLVDGQLRGLALLPDHCTIVVRVDGQRDPVAARTFTPRPGANSAHPTGIQPQHTHVVRFVAPVGTATTDQVHVIARDKAGNSLELNTDVLA